MYQTIIPSPDTIPVHWAWFEVLLIITFFVHMILMNFMLGGSLLTLWDLIRGKGETKASSSIPTIIALTINFGVPPLLFLQVLYGHFFYSSSVLMAVPWILVIPVLILAYYGAYIYTKKIEKAPKWSRAGLIISSVLLLYIAFVFVNNNTLALRPERWSMYFDRPNGMNFNLGEPTLWPRYLHFLLSALAIGALGRAIYYHFAEKNEEHKNMHIKRNLKIFGWITVIQFAIGTWFWFSMPKDVWMIFMGKGLLATILMGLGWLIALLILHSAFTGRLKTSMLFAGLQIMIMILIRDLSRQAYLGTHFHPRDLETAKELSPFIVFLLVFVAGLFLIYYMLKLMSKPKTK